MTNQEKVTQMYPEAWYRVYGPHSAMIWSSDDDNRRVLASSKSSRNRRKLWSAAWAVVRNEAIFKKAAEGAIKCPDCGGANFHERGCSAWFGL